MSNINNRYIIQNEIGSGGMGMVYRAFDRLTQQQIAIKRLLIPPAFLQFDAKEANYALFVLAHEFEILASLRHPHIVSVYDYGFDQTRAPYLTMELVENARTLTEATTNLSLHKQIALILQLLQALAYLHRRGIIHRDLKPENVLVRDIQVQVLDFGLAIEQGQKALPEGTLLYTAPEILNGESASIASDLYAVGVIFYEILAGKNPFDTGRMSGAIARIKQGIVDISLVDAAPTIQAIVAKLLATNPSERYPDAFSVIQAISEVAESPLEESSAIRESFIQAAKFVGRQAEIEQLTNALSNTRNGNGGIWLISGESGVGKSRLMDEIRIQAAAQGILTLRGQGIAEGGLFFQLWRDVIRHLLLEVTVNDFEASVLKAIVPDIETLLQRPVSDAPTLRAKDQYSRLTLTIVEFVRRYSNPLIILLEDLQWADESLAPLKYLAAHGGKQSLLIIGNYRNDEQSKSLDDLPSSINTILLGRLSTAEITKLGQSILGTHTKTTVLDFLTEQTEGNTFFLVETIRALAEEMGRLADIPDMDLPTSGILTGGIQRLLDRRLNQVPANFQPLLKLAVVAGRQLDLELLVLMKDSVNLQTWLTQCADSSVIEVHQNQWRFSHDKLCEALLAQMGDNEKSVLHARVAKTIEIVYPDDNQQLERLTDHWFAAKNLEKASHFTVEATKYLQGVAAYYNRAQVLLERIMKQADIETVSRYPELLIRLGENLNWRYLSDDAIKHLHAALELVEPHQKELIATIHLQLVRVFHHIRDYDQTKYHIEQANALGKELNDQKLLVHNNNILGLIAMDNGDFDNARLYYNQALEIAQSIN